MLRVAGRRLENKKRKVLPRKPQPPDEWLMCQDKSVVIDFFWDWLAADCDPTFTPDGKPWIDQDRTFWKLVYYIHDLYRWAEKKAELPKMRISPGDLSLDKL